MNKLFNIFKKIIIFSLVCFFVPTSASIRRKLSKRAPEVSAETKCCAPMSYNLEEIIDEFDSHVNLETVDEILEFLKLHFLACGHPEELNSCCIVYKKIIKKFPQKFDIIRNSVKTFLERFNENSKTLNVFSDYFIYGIKIYKYLAKKKLFTEDDFLFIKTIVFESKDLILNNDVLLSSLLSLCEILPDYDFSPLLVINFLTDSFYLATHPFAQLKIAGDISYVYSAPSLINLFKEKIESGNLNENDRELSKKIILILSNFFVRLLEEEKLEKEKKEMDVNALAEIRNTKDFARRNLAHICFEFSSDDKMLDDILSFLIEDPDLIKMYQYFIVAIDFKQKGLDGKLFSELTEREKTDLKEFVVLLIKGLIKLQFMYDIEKRDKIRKDIKYCSGKYVSFLKKCNCEIIQEVLNDLFSKNDIKKIQQGLKLIVILSFVKSPLILKEFFTMILKKKALTFLKKLGGMIECIANSLGIEKRAINAGIIKDKLSTDYSMDYSEENIVEFLLYGDELIEDINDALYDLLRMPFIASGLKPGERVRSDL